MVEYSQDKFCFHSNFLVLFLIQWFWHFCRIHVRSIEHTPNPARETGSAGKPLPPGFHKGTNDTKPRSARRHTRSPSTASSPTLTRSMSRNGVESSSGRRTIFHELSELNRIGVDTIVTDFRAMDER